MAIPKCRLDVWSPSIGGTAVNKWITVLNPEYKNAVMSVFMLDRLGNPRVAEIVVSNRAKNFASAAGTFSYTYRDSDGANAVTITNMLQKTGVLTDFFQDFQHIRLVDQATNQVLYAGRIRDISSSYEGRIGEVIKIKCFDSLYELMKISSRGLCEDISFAKTTNSITDMVKSLISVAYKKEYLDLKDTKHVTAVADAGLVRTSDLTANTTHTAAYNANIVTDDDDTTSIARFSNETTKLSSDRKLSLKKLNSEGLLGQILKLVQHNPQTSQVNNETFGWDYFVDPNISYKITTPSDFKGKNLGVSTPPPPNMFNLFERGTRIHNIEPATYGLSVKFPADTPVKTVGHKTVVGGATTVATKPMSTEWDFQHPKDGLYTSVLAKYNDASVAAQEAENKKKGGTGQEKELIMEIMYVTAISGQFKIAVITGSGETEVTEELDPDDESSLITTGVVRPGLYSTEWLALYDASNNLVKSKAARIQYQSHTSISGSTNYGYILVSHVHSDLLTRTGMHTLKGYGDGTGTQASNVTCTINLSSNVAHQGYPRKVWGLEKQKTISRGAITDLKSIRQEAASILSRSSVDIVDGAFQISGAPMYHWDGEIRSIASASPGQTISVKDVGGSGFVYMPRFGFRAGMLIAKMNATFTAIDQDDGNDIYGYCYDVPTSGTYTVDLTEDINFAVGDKVRFFMPLRAGDTIRVENPIALVAGNHLITEIEYTEEPNQMTRIKSTGVNEGMGLLGSIYDIILAGSREESDLRMNLPKGHQIAVWTGLFSAVDANTVQWQTVGGKAEVALQDGTIYNIDCATTNSNNTTDASGTDAESTRFGLATAPAVGDTTVYYIYADPNKENVTREGGKYHFYTRPATTPATGSDPVYEQDGDNIIIGWMKAAANAEGLAEFGVYRDSKPGEGKRDAALVTHAGTTTSALLKKGAQTFSTDLTIAASAWANDLAFREVKWHGGASDTTNATIKLADGGNRTIAYGGDSGDNGQGTYSYTTNGSSYSTIQNFDVSSTYYAFLDFAEDSSGNMLVRWSKDVGVPYGDDRILLAMIVTAADATKGRSPLIFPLTTKSLAINAVVIAANCIIGDHIQANTIATGHITGRIEGGKIQITGQTEFASGYDPSQIESGNKTTASTGQPSNPVSGDLWIDTNSTPANKLYRYSGSAWVEFDLGLASAGSIAAQATADSKRTTFTGSSAVPVAIGDIWINSSDQKIYSCAQTGGSTIGTHWILRDDAGAINGATTDINGGRIATQAIVLKAGGGKILETDAALGSGTRVLLHNDGIYGYNGSTSQFYLLASDGKAYFGAGSIMADNNGLHVATGNSKFIEFGATNNTGAFIQYYGNLNTGTSLRIGKDDGEKIAIVGSLVPGISLGGSNIGNDVQDGGFGVICLARPNRDVTLLTTNNSGELLVEGSVVGGSAGVTSVSAGTGMSFSTITSTGAVNHQTGAGWTHIPSGGDTDQVLTYSSSGVATWEDPASGGGSYTHPDPIQLGTGSQSAPTYSFSVQTGTGMFRTSGSVCFAANGDELLRCNDTYSKMYNYGKVYIQTMDSTSGGVYVKWEDGNLKQSSSTERSKMNIRDLDVDSTKIYDLVPKSFEFRTPQMVIEGEKHRNVVDENGRLLYTDTPESTSFGMVAEAVNEVLPELVLSAAADGLPDGVDYPMLSVLVLAELKKLRDRIEVLEGN